MLETPQPILDEVLEPDDLRFVPSGYRHDCESGLRTSVGALQFYDRDDHIEEGYLPTFNALNLFRVPKRHSVTQVTSFGGLRYSISGG